MALFGGKLPDELLLHRAQGHRSSQSLCITCKCVSNGGFWLGMTHPSMQLFWQLESRCPQRTEQTQVNPSYFLGLCSLGRSQPGRQLPLQIPLPGNNVLYFWKEDKTKERRAIPTNIHLLFYLCKAPAPSSPRLPVV